MSLTLRPAETCRFDLVSLGEVMLRGNTVMKGYLDDPVATALALRDGWLHTGDIGFLDDAGGLRVNARADFSAARLQRSVDLALAVLDSG